MFLDGTALSCVCRHKPPHPGDTGIPIVLFVAQMILFLSLHHSSQAIKDLQAEVSRLRLQLEDSLHRPHPDSPACVASAFNHSTQTQEKLVDSSPSWGSHYGR